MYFLLCYFCLHFLPIKVYNNQITATGREYDFTGFSMKTIYNKKIILNVKTI